MLNENEQSAATLYDNAGRIPNGSLLADGNICLITKQLEQFKGKKR